MLYGGEVLLTGTPMPPPQPPLLPLPSPSLPPLSPVGKSQGGDYYETLRCSRDGGWKEAGSAVRRRGAEGLVTCEDRRVAKELLEAHRLLGAAAQRDGLGRLVNDDPVGSLARVLAHEDH